MGIEHGLPVLHLAYALLTVQVLLNVGRPRRVVKFVPVSFAGLISLLLLPPTPPTLALLGRSVKVLVFLGGGPISEGATRLCGCGRCFSCYCCWYGRRRLGKGRLWLARLLDLGAADGLEAQRFRTG
jgi:hypothetical protein